MLNDTRGTMTIPGIFASAFLIGGIWYLVGLGDAMVFHQTMRDAADATAFAPSVIQARGMNVLALVNLVMSAILAVLVAVKIVQLLLMAANVIACSIPKNPLCPLLSSWQSPMSDFVQLSDQSVTTVNEGLYAAQTALAKVIPIVGQAKAVAAAGSFGSMVQGGFAASLSLVPGELEQSSGEGSSGVGKQRWGLPVEDEDYSNLCLHASKGVVDILFKPLKFLPGSQVIVEPIKGLAGHLIGTLVKAFPQYFCGGGGLGMADLGNAVGGVIGDMARQGLGKIAGNVCRGAGSARALCAAGMQAGFGSLARGSAMTGEQQTSKRIYSPAAVGGDYFSSFGFTFSNALEEQDVDARISAISWGHVGADPQAELAKVLSTSQITKAEFYPDPRRGGPTAWSSGAGSLRESSLLDMRWRARLRRFSPPTEVHRALLVGAGLASIVQSIKSTRGARPAVIIGVFLGNDPATLSRWAESAIGTTQSKSTGGLLH